MNLKYFLLTAALTLAVLAGLEKIAPPPKELMYPHKSAPIDERPVLVKFEENGPIEIQKPLAIWNGSTCDGG